MKHDELRSIAHNIADSLASGCGLMIGVFDVNVFAEAAKTPSGSLEIDVLTGQVLGGPVSPALSDAVRRYAEALPALCARHGTSAQAFRELRMCYGATGGARRFTVKITDENGRSSITEYGNVPGQRVKQLDHQGRLRPKPMTRSRAP